VRLLKPATKHTQTHTHTHQLMVVIAVRRVDCVGILKLRNADVEARIGVAGSKKKSTRARLVFRVNVPGPDGSLLTLQALSSPILCSESLLFLSA